MGRKIWSLGNPDKDLAAQISEAYSLDPFAALLLSQRGMKSKEQLDAFFDSSEELMNPFLLPDMQVAVDRIDEAIFSGERICVFGDYDADGVTSTALLYSYLEAQGADVIYLLPDRETDGYGLSRGVVDRMQTMDTNLIITVDNGIAAIEEAKHIREKGMDLIVTDHHLPGEILPDCIAIVDPHRLDSDCPFKDYCGVGVAFKLACAMEGSQDSVIANYIDLVALGTVADLVPLTGENRKLVKLGLDALNADPRPGISALVDKCGLAGKILTSQNISFGLAPRINAAGRMESAEQALDLLLAEDSQVAQEMAEQLEELNSRRHEAEQKIYREAVAWLKEHPTVPHLPVLVVYGEDWHEGVLGIVASKLLSRYLRPVIILTKKDNTYKGSCRSIEGFHIYHALKACDQYLLAYGGHELAAGMTVEEDKLPDFIHAINQVAYQQEPVFPKLQIDCKLLPEAVQLSLLDSIALLEPFGTDNPSPVFGLFNVVIEQVRHMGDSGQHIRLQIHKENHTTGISVVRFSDPHFSYEKGDKVDLVCTLSRNSYNGTESVSTIVQDIRPAGADDRLMVKGEAVFDRIRAKAALSAEQAAYALPDRTVFASLYTFLKQGGSYDTQAYEYLYYKTNVPENNLCKTRVALIAMKELNLLELNEQGLLTVPAVTEKVDLQNAPILQQIRQYLNERRR